jgi:hypothetical protein
MKHLPMHDSGDLSRTLMCMFGLFLATTLAAQTFDTTPPTISHQPVKLGRLGKPLALATVVGDNGGVRNVVVKASHEGTPVEIPMGQGPSVPLKVRVSTPRLDVYSGPGSENKKVGVMAAGDVADVTQLRDRFVRIRMESGMVGYIELADCVTLDTGCLYRATLPVEWTSGGTLSYQIFAMDNFGNESQTSVFEVRLIDEAQLAQMQAQMGLVEKETKTGEKSSIRRSRPIYKSLWFWVGAAAVGGGAYFLLSGGDEGGNSSKTTVDVIIGW